MNLKPHSSQRRLRQRGAAALVVVLVLFFIVSMVAAYASRTMIFEQKTSANQYRSTQALEVAEAGLEWGVAMLNSGRLNATCQADPAGANTFRDRYLQFAAGTELITPVPGTSATCIFSPGAGWACTCPAAGASMPPTAGPGPFVAFRLHFRLDGERIFDVTVVSGSPLRGAVRLVSHGCTGVDAGCLNFPQTPAAGQANASASVLVGVKGAISTVPAAALTLPAADTAAPSLILTGGTTVAASNVDSRTGIAVQAGGILPVAGLSFDGPAGSPKELSKISPDLTLTATALSGGLRNSADAGACAPGALHDGCSFNRLFTGVFGTSRGLYQNQPAVVICPAGCNSAALALLAANNPRSVLRVVGNVTLDGNLGTAADPVALLVEGDVAISGAGTVVTGLVYGTSGNWTVNGTPVIVGSAVAEQALTLSGGGALDLRYDADALGMLRSRYGSFVRLPGSWRDWQP